VSAAPITSADRPVGPDGSGQVPRRPVLRHAEVDRRRETPGESALLFLTDRCPVGCAHCSVDSRPDSPRITDVELFGEIVDTLCASDLNLIGISGGDPFVERRALSLATARLAAAGKDLVVYTSGFWAGGPEVPRWTGPVLRRCACVYLSTDAFHQAGVAEERFVSAARATAMAGAWIVVQVLDLGDMSRRAADLLGRAFGRSWPDWAELVPIPPLPYGRAATLFPRTHRRPGRELTTPCRIVASPVIRYDGAVSACCNEAVLMGRGPAGLRRRCGSGAEVADAVGRFRDTPFLRAVAAVGPGPLTADPRLADLADEQVSGICELCWKMTDRLDLDVPDRVLATVAELGDALRRDGLR
jgi:hypothetical protein